MKKNSKRKLKITRNLIKNNSGQTVAEYVILLGLVVVISVITLGFFLNMGYRTAFNKYGGLLAVPYIYQ